MKNIGIIVAMQEEYNEIIKIMNNTVRGNVYNIEYIKGIIGDNNIIIVMSGVGKVNAARTTQIIIDKFDLDFIINVGSAGALSPELNIGDIVIGDKLIQHDFDITAFEHKKGYITGVGDYICSDIHLVEKLLKIANKMNKKEYNIIKGTIASGDIFCTDKNMKDKIYNKFNAQCVEMEGAAIAQVCFLDKIPFIIIRSISDSPNGKNAVVFEEFVSLAAQRCAIILKELLKK